MKLTVLTVNGKELSDNKETSEAKINDVSDSIETEKHLTTEQVPEELHSSQNRLSFASVTGNGPIILCDDIRPTNNGKWY